MTAGRRRAALGPPPYLTGLRLAGRRVVVVGGGSVAQRRVGGLLATGAEVVVVSPEATPAVEDMASVGELVWEHRAYRVGDLDGAWYVVAATSDARVNAEVARHAEAQRVFCVRSDDAETGTAWTPATGRHGAVGIAVLGGDPRRSVAVRDHLLDTLTTMGPAGLGAGDHAGSVAVVGAGPGAADLVTVRALRLLRSADVVVADRLVPRELLDGLAAEVEVIDAAKVPYGRFMAQDEINRQLVEHARAGRFVVRLKGGDPFVFGRGYEEVQACAAAGLPVVVVPGVTSAISVPAAAGIPVTHRGTSQAFVVVSGHVPPGDPRSSIDWVQLAACTATIVLLMGVRNLGAIATALMAGGLPPDTPVACVQEGTLARQRVVRTTLRRAARDVIAAEVSNPAVIVIGDVAALEPGDPPSAAPVVRPAAGEDREEPVQ